MPTDTCCSSGVLAPERENGVFTGELRPYHFAEPGDSLVNHLWWRAPDRPGEYVAVAGARGAAGLQDPSTPVRLTVR